VDTDSDGIADFRDVDSDDDFIPDAIEARPTAGYTSAIGTGDADSDGILDGNDSNNFTGSTNTHISDPEDSDGDGTADYIDTDSDNDGYSDQSESGLIVPGATNADPDGAITNPQTALENEFGSNVEVAYREIVDNDGDGISDGVDEDDDNESLKSLSRLH